MTIPRRDFMLLAASAALPLPASGLRVEGPPSLARKELLRGLNALFPALPIAPNAALTLTLDLAPAAFPNPEAYSIRRTPRGATLAAASSQALLYCVFDFLEHQGALYAIDGENFPLDLPQTLQLPEPNQAWDSTPLFSTRGLLPWPDFLNCISVFNEEDLRAYFEAMLRMRFNTFGMHAYTGANQWAESYLSFEFAGAGHLAFLDNSASHRWGYLPQRTSTFGMGAAQFYDSETFGSDATRLGRDPWEVAERTRTLLRHGLDYAHSLGLRTGLGFEPYQIPDEIFRALPPEVKRTAKPGQPAPAARFDIESRTAERLLETRLAQLLEAYPNLDHVWLWEDENMNWESRKTGIPLSVTPFLQAHRFLQRHAPKKRLVLAGWGGVARHFEHFHRQLPGDVIFSALSDSLGWDPVHEVFSKLESRERWPIPWLEDDPGMWLPQFHTHRFQRDLELAQDYGCQGMIGIHWRHRIVDPTASYMARRSWDRHLQPAEHYSDYAATQAAGPRAAALAATLTEADRDRTLLSTGTFEHKDGHVVTREYSGDYTEGFTFWNDYEPAPSLVASQRQVAASLLKLLAEAGSPAEAARLAHIARHVGFLVPYTDAWLAAHRLHKLLAEGDKEKIRSVGVPLYLELAARTREAMLVFQSVVATRNDLGTLASLQNKLVRLTLHRLPLSIEERLGELPPEIDAARRQALSPAVDEAPRLIVPTRPTMLAAADKVRVMAIVTGNAPVAACRLHRRSGAAWTVQTMRLLGRRTYEIQLSLPLDAWYVSAETGPARLLSPAAAPRDFYRITNLG